MTSTRTAEFPVDSEGRVHHVGVKAGDVANRVITVGDPARAYKLAQYLDEPKEKLLIVSSSRGFLTITGHFNKVPVSIVAIGMGVSMMDFFVREVRSVVEGPMLIVRFGSCGGIGPDATIGSLTLASETAFCYRNYDHFSNPEQKQPYFLSQPIKGDEAYEQEFRKAVGDEIKLVSGLNVTCDSFYGSQGRPDPNFSDNNANQIDWIKSVYPQAISLEMESYMLYHLGHCALAKDVRTFAFHMVFANRLANEFIEDSVRDEMEPKVSKFALQALSATQL